MLCLPGFPVTDFRRKAPIGTYSGGTVQDSHLIVLFSGTGLRAYAATKWPYSVVKLIVAQKNALSIVNFFPFLLQSPGSLLK